MFLATRLPAVAGHPPPPLVAAHADREAACRGTIHRALLRSVGFQPALFLECGSLAAAFPSPKPSIQRRRESVICSSAYYELAASGTAMTNTPITEQITHRWYTRPVLFVADVNRALRFYIDMFGFQKSWHEGDGAGKVCQVHRAECEIILCEDATRRDKARLFVELTAEGLAALRREILERSVPTEQSWWGYDVVKIVDPDGNELLFPAAE
jgi:catechol 2,3-dioxygenase-like lactoylglutathione lyase family enzyme